MASKKSAKHGRHANTKTLQKYQLFQDKAKHSRISET